jgi:hypothetical protein
MPLVDGIKTFAAEHAPDLCREKAVVLSKQDLITFCMDFDLPMFKMEKVVFKDRLVEKKTNLNVLFTPFRGIWVMAYEDAEEGEKDGQ